MVFGRFLLVVKPRLFLLQMSGVSQYDGTQINGRRRCVDWPAESFFGQPGNPAAVVEMGVRQNYSVDIMRRNGSIFPVPQPPLLGALKKPAVNEHLHARLVRRIVARVDEVF